MDNPITTDEITAGIPEAQRRYFLVSSCTISREGLPVIEAFWEAVRLFAPVARFSHPIHVIIATRPFRIPLGSGTLEYHPKEQTVASAVEHFVFLDVIRLSGYARPFQVATIIEEFVHSLLHISDETLASSVVALIYPAVRFDGTRFALSAPPTGGTPKSTNQTVCTEL